MKTVKGFNKIQNRNRIFGLEFFDLLILMMIYLVVFVFSSNLFVNLAVIGFAYMFLKLYKKGKPPHWPGSVIRFLFIPKRFGQSHEERWEIFR